MKKESTSSQIVDGHVQGEVGARLTTIPLSRKGWREGRGPGSPAGFFTPAGPFFKGCTSPGTRGVLFLRRGSRALTVAARGVGTTRRSSAASFVFGEHPLHRLQAFVDRSHYDRMRKRDEQGKKSINITYFNITYISPGFPHPPFTQSRNGVKGSRHASNISRHRLSRFVGDLDEGMSLQLSSTASGIGLHLF